MTIPPATPRTEDSFPTSLSAYGSCLVLREALLLSSPRKGSALLPPPPIGTSPKFRCLVFRVGHLLAPPQELERVVGELQRNWYDTRESLKDLSDVAARCMGIPVALAAALRAEAFQGKLLKRHAGPIPPMLPMEAGDATRVSGDGDANGTNVPQPGSGALPSPRPSDIRRMVRHVGHFHTPPQELEQIADTLETSRFNSRESLKHLSDATAAHLGVPPCIAASLRQEATSKRLLMRYKGPLPPHRSMSPPRSLGASSPHSPITATRSTALDFAGGFCRLHPVAAAQSPASSSSRRPAQLAQPAQLARRRPTSRGVAPWAPASAMREVREAAMPERGGRMHSGSERRVQVPSEGEMAVPAERVAVAPGAAPFGLVTNASQESIARLQLPTQQRVFHQQPVVYQVRQPLMPQSSSAGTIGAFAPSRCQA